MRSGGRTRETALAILCTFLLHGKTFSFLASPTLFSNTLISRQNHRHAPLCATDPDVQALLDAEQEQGIVNRAAFEETLLIESSGSRDTLTESTETERKEATKLIKKSLKEGTRGRGGGGGFGGKEESDAPSSIFFNPSRDKDGFGAIVKHKGVARINSVLSIETATSILNYVNEEKIRSEAAIAEGKVKPLSRFTNVLLKQNRWDLLLPMEESDEVMKGLYELLGDGDSAKRRGSVGSVIESTVGKDAELYELACLISDPGSERQVIHPDIAHIDSDGNVIPLVTCFVALQDIDVSMGPSEFLPETNTAAHHKRLNNHAIRDELLSEVSSKISLLNVGDCSTFDATTLHAGGGNKSNTRRCLFYFTFRNLSLDDPRTTNNPGSIRPEVKERRLSLVEIRKVLKKWKAQIST
eukprot:CAMPEP_0198285290 /NCGR_PEP_ID=MMETSP1449-20131203/4623_1 /TAXON_ID=420275 /ORGANISM="Attheya septentrionalis, Strain CCMP2084" /LENGTH=411 /DNA_ID=CAMNT_0043982675 /DNA_START=69 /DNA_END=1304 /DNA_ORIENTATION=+